MKPMKPNTKTIAYIRVSTEKQNTDVQKNEILQHAQQNKMMIQDFITVEVSSRKSQQKRKIEHLKEQLQPGDTVIATELSRLGRSMIEILTLIEYFRSNNIAVVFTKQPELSTNENNPLQTLLFSIYGYFAEAERELISERVKGGMATARKEGKQIGRKKGTTGRSIFDQDKERIQELHKLGVSNNKIIKLHLKYGTPAGLGKFMKKSERVKSL